MENTQISQVRRFNRLVTQRVGALEESYLGRGRPLGEARIIFETGDQGIDVRVLRKRLGLDSGYLSRLLRSLERQGLIRLAKQAEDGRQRRVCLTPKGCSEYAIYGAFSDELAKAILEPLDPAQRDALVGAMAEVERLMRTAAIALRVEPPASADARCCLDQYFRELSERFDSGFDPSRSNPAPDEDMTPPTGYFVLAYLEGEPVGCGALKRLDTETGEIKRMWSAPFARGQGVARAVLRKLEAMAREAGLKTLHLETNRTLKEAQALYRKEGYLEVAPFNDEAYAHHWFEKRL